ncbi:uncharacterized protein SPPG_07328, partial [Spizellomyces punctatus DAOM BR117]
MREQKLAAAKKKLAKYQKQRAAGLPRSTSATPSETAGSPPDSRVVSPESSVENLHADAGGRPRTGSMLSTSSIAADERSASPLGTLTGLRNRTDPPRSGSPVPTFPPNVQRIATPPPPAEPDLIQRVRELASDNQHLARRMRELSNENRELKEKMKQFEVHGVPQEKAEVAADMDGRIAELTAHLEEARSAATEAEAERTELSRELQQLRTRLDETDTLAQQLEALKEENENLRQGRTEQQQHSDEALEMIQQMREDAEIFRKEKLAGESKIKQLELELSQLQSAEVPGSVDHDSAQLNADLEMTRSQLDSAQNTIQQQATELEEVRGELERMQAVAGQGAATSSEEQTGVIEDLRNQLANAKETTKEQASEITEIRQQLAVLEKAHGDLATENELLASKAATAASSGPSTVPDADLVLERDELTSQVQKLKEELQAITEEYEQCKAEVTTLRDENATLMADRDAHASQMEELSSTQGELQMQVQTLAQDNEAIRRQHVTVVGNMRKLLEDMSGRSAAATREKEAMTIRVRELEEEVKRVRNEYPTLLSANAEAESKLQQLESDVEYLRTEREQLLTEMDLMKENIKERELRAAEDTNTLVETMRDLTDQVADLKKQITQLTKEKADAVLEKDALERKVEELSSVDATHKEELHRSQSMMMDELNERQALISDLQSQLDVVRNDATAELAEKARQLQEVSAQLEDLRIRSASESTAKDNDIKSLNQKLQEHAAKEEQLAASAEELTVEVHSLQQQLAEEIQKRESTEDRVRLLEAELQAREELIASITRERSLEIEGVLDQRDQSIKELMEAQEQLASVVAARAELEQLLEGMQPEKIAREREIATLTAQKEALVLKLREFATEKDNAARQVTELSAGLADAEAALDMLNEEKEMLQMAMAEADRVLRAQLAEANERYNHLVSEGGDKAKELKKELDIVTEERDRRLAEVNELVAERDGLHDRIARIMEKFDGRTEEIERLHQERDAALQERERMAAECDELQAQIELVEVERKRVHTAMEEGVVKMTELEARVMTLEEEKGALREEVDIREEERAALIRELDSLKETVDTFRQRKDEEEKERSVWKQRIEEVNARVGEISEENERLLQSLNARETHIAYLQEELEREQLSVAEISQKLTDLETASNEQVAARQELETVSEIIRKEREDALEKVAALEQMIPELEAQMEQERGVLSAAQKEAEQRHAVAQSSLEDVGAQVLRITQERETLASERDVLEARTQELQAQVTALEEERHSLMEERDRSTAIVQTLQGQLVEMEETISMLEEDYESRLDERGKVLIDLQTTKDEFAHRNTVLEAEIELLTKSTEQNGRLLEEERALVQELQKALEDLQTSFEEIRTRMGEQKNAHEEEKSAMIKSFAERDEEEKLKLQDIVNVMKGVVGAVGGGEQSPVDWESTPEGSLDELTASRTRLLVRINDLARKMRDMVEMQSLSLASAGEVEQRLHQIRAEHDAVSQAKTKLEQRVKKLEGVETELRGQLDEAIELSASREEESRQLRATVDALEREKEVMEKSHNALVQQSRDEAARLVTELENARQEVQRVSKELYEATQAHSLDSSLPDALEKLREEQDRSSALAMELADVKLKLEGKERALEVLKRDLQRVSESQMSDTSATSPVSHDTLHSKDLSQPPVTAATVDQLRHRVTMLTEERDLMRSEVREKTRMIDELHVRTSTLEADVQSLERALGEADEVLRENEIELRRNNLVLEELDDKRALVVKLEEEITALQSRVLQLEDAAIARDELKKEVDGLREMVEAKSAQIRHMAADFDARLAEEKALYLRSNRDGHTTDTYEADDEEDGLAARGGRVRRPAKRTPSGNVATSSIADMRSLVSHVVGVVGDYQSAVAALVARKDGFLDLLRSTTVGGYERLPKRILDDLNILITKLHDVEDQHVILGKELSSVGALIDTTAKGGLGRPVSDHEGNYHLTPGEYADLYEKAAAAEQYQRQLENSHALLKDHAMQTQVLKDALQSMTQESTSTQRQNGNEKVLQRQLDELRRVWTHELEANTALRELITRTQRDAMHAQDKARAAQARMREEFDELVDLLDAATKDAEMARSDVKLLEDKLNNQFFEHQEAASAQEEMHTAERKALEGLVDALERERDRIVDDFRRVKERLEEKILQGETQIRHLEEVSLEKDDRIRRLDGRVQHLEDARRSAEIQVLRLEKERGRLVDRRHPSDAKTQSPSDAGDEGLRDEVGLLQKELKKIRQSSREMMVVLRETLKNTIGDVSGSGHDVMAVLGENDDKVAKVDMSRIKEQCRQLISEVLYLRALVDRLSTWRADLKYQKLYLSLTVQSHRATLAGVGLEPSGVGSDKPVIKLKRCVDVVRSLIRMRILARNWKQALSESQQHFFAELCGDTEPILSRSAVGSWENLLDLEQDDPRMRELEEEVIRLKDAKLALENENERLAKAVASLHHLRVREGEEERGWEVAREPARDSGREMLRERRSLRDAYTREDDRTERDTYEDRQRVSSSGRYYGESTSTYSNESTAYRGSNRSGQLSPRWAPVSRGMNGRLQERRRGGG